MLLEQSRTRSSAGPSADIMSLRGKRLVWASETGDGRNLDAGRVKWLCGGDTLVGRMPYARREVTFRPSHTLIVLTNHKPKVDPTDFAVWDRIHLVPFEYSFVDNPKKPNERLRDPQLLDRLKSEASGVLALMVRGCLEWQEQGLNPPPEVIEATAAYRRGEDLIGQFIDECCVVDKHCQARAGKLWDEYQAWCDSNGCPSATRNKFADYLLEQFDRIDGRHRVYMGIGLKTKDENAGN